MWYDESVIYQIYPLGFCGAPEENDGVPARRLLKVLDWIPHFKRLGVDFLFFNPLFESDRHGYDTRDFRRVDVRLGEGEDLARVVSALHEAGIRVMLDAVFNHVGRGFWAFRDVLERREASPYRDWFKIDFNGNNGYGDGLRYSGWEGHEELVELNLEQPGLVDYLLDCVGEWMERFAIDGLRLDVAYMLNRPFMERLRTFCLDRRPDFFLMGEMIHGDYRQIVNERMLHSCTNYGGYKSLYSAFNSLNLFEIGHSLQRQSGDEPWALYRGLNLVNFADNHDVNRIASELNDAAQLPALYTLLFGMPGIPALYYGSEWGARGKKGAGREGDLALRPDFAAPEWNALTEHIAALCRLRRASRALAYGSFRIVLMNNRQLIFERRCADERLLIAVNADDRDFHAHFDAGCGRAEELLSGKPHDFGGGSLLPAHSSQVWRMER